MSIEKSISSFKSKTQEISDICHKKDEPVYLTRKGKSELVVMSTEHYDKLKAKIDLFEKLAVAQAQSAAGEKGITHKQMMKKIRSRINAK